MAIFIALLLLSSLTFVLGWLVALWCSSHKLHELETKLANTEAKLSVAVDENRRLENLRQELKRGMIRLSRRAEIP